MTPSCLYQGLISHFQDYLQTFSATVVVLGIPIVLYHSWQFPTFLPTARDEDTEVGF
jgi:hypothetical protein